MKAPATPVNEIERLQTLQALRILDTAPEERFDRFTRLARRLFGVEVVLVTLVDAQRQWFKSAQGTALLETPRDISFCGHALLGDGLMLVPDATLDPRFADNPLVLGDPHIRFYAGHTLRAPNGHKIGTLCLIDSRPRPFGAEDQALLRDLAQMVEHEFAILQLATLDELTGLTNRRGFESLVGHSLSMCRRLKRPASLLYFDLDGFKQINDSHGHAEGDQALVDFAQQLQGNFRQSDVVARLGGDEFAVLLTDAAHHEREVALQRLGEALALHQRLHTRPYRLDYSVGCADFEPSLHADARALMAEADRLMYRHKQAGGGAR